jgi:hypothetical protein
MATRDLTIAFEAVKAKQSKYTALFDYYHGQQPVAYLHKRVERMFQGVLDQRFSANWCAVVVDAMLDRLKLLGVQGPEEDGDAAEAGETPPWLEAFEALWNYNQMPIEAMLTHETASICGEAAVIVWPLREDGSELDVPAVYYNDPRMIHVQYRNDRPREVAWAAKFYTDEDEKVFATFYYPDRLEYYATGKRWTGTTQASSFQPDPTRPPAANPYSPRIPVFHFRTHARRVVSDLASVIPLQNAINKLLADMMVGAEFGAFPQRWIISNLDQLDLTRLPNSPGHNWALPSGTPEDGQTQVGQFSAYDLQNYLAPITHLIDEVGAVTRTPRHYFLHEDGAFPSGEAQARAEAPLNDRVEHRITTFDPVWLDCFDFMLELAGYPNAPLATLWKPVGSLPPQAEASLIETYTRAGMPLASALRKAGASEEEIAQVMQEKAAEEEARRASIGEMYADAQAQFDQTVAGSE